MHYDDDRDSTDLIKKTSIRCALCSILSYHFYQELRHVSVIEFCADLMTELEAVSI